MPPAVGSSPSSSETSQGRATYANKQTPQATHLPGISSLLLAESNWQTLHNPPSPPSFYDSKDTSYNSQGSTHPTAQLTSNGLNGSNGSNGIPYPASRNGTTFGETRNQAFSRSSNDASNFNGTKTPDTMSDTATKIFKQSNLANHTAAASGQYNTLTPRPSLTAVSSSVPVPRAGDVKVEPGLSQLSQLSPPHFHHPFQASQSGISNSRTAPPRNHRASISAITAPTPEIISPKSPHHVSVSQNNAPNDIHYNPSPEEQSRRAALNSGSSPRERYQNPVNGAVYVPERSSSAQLPDESQNTPHLPTPTSVGSVSQAQPVNPTHFTAQTPYQAPHQVPSQSSVQEVIQPSAGVPLHMQYQLAEAPNSMIGQYAAPTSNQLPLQYSSQISSQISSHTPLQLSSANGPPAVAFTNPAPAMASNTIVMQSNEQMRTMYNMNAMGFTRTAIPVEAASPYHTANQQYSTSISGQSGDYGQIGANAQTAQALSSYQPYQTSSRQFQYLHPYSGNEPYSQTGAERYADGLASSPYVVNGSALAYQNGYQNGYYPSVSSAGNSYAMGPQFQSTVSLNSYPQAQPMPTAANPQANDMASSSLLLQTWMRNGQAEHPRIKRRTKTGCLTCRKRRIKCDETHPVCKYCDRSQRICLGYDPVFANDRFTRVEKVWTLRRMAPYKSTSYSSTDIISRIRTWGDVVTLYIEHLAPDLDHLLGTQRFSFVGKLVADQLSTVNFRTYRVAGELEAMRQVLAMIFEPAQVPGLREISLCDGTVALERLRMTDEYCLLRALSEALSNPRGEFLPSLLAADKAPVERLHTLRSLLYSDGMAGSGQFADTKVTLDEPLLSVRLWQLAKQIEEGNTLTAEQIYCLKLPNNSLLSLLLLKTTCTNTQLRDLIKERTLNSPLDVALMEIALGTSA